MRLKAIELSFLCFFGWVRHGGIPAKRSVASLGTAQDLAATGPSGLPRLQGKGLRRFVCALAERCSGCMRRTVGSSLPWLDRSISQFLVHQVVQGPSLVEPDQVVQQHLGRPFTVGLGLARVVARDNHVAHVPQRRIRRQRLFVGDIQARALDPASPAGPGPGPVRPPPCPGRC